MWDNPIMKFRLGLIAGLIIGYLLGARAGRERYDQIVAAYNKARSNDVVRRATEITEQTTRTTRAVAGNTLVKSAETIRARAER